MKRSYIPYIFLIPFFMHFAIFWVYRLGFALSLSFTNWDPLSPHVEFVGLQNYVNALSDEIFISSIKNALIYVLFEPICNAIGFALAIILNSAIKGRSVFRTIFFFPVISSTVAITWVWSQMYEYRSGLFNYALGLIGFPRQPFLNSSAQALYCIMLMSIWQWAGLNVVIYLAGLQSIPKELHEAARISGANAWNCFRHITIPLMKPTILFCAVTATAGSLQVFTEFYMLINPVGIVAIRNMVPLVFMYNQFRLGYYAYASAMSFIFFLVIFAFVLMEIRLLYRGGMVYY